MDAFDADRRRARETLDDRGPVGGVHRHAVGAAPRSWPADRALSEVMAEHARRRCEPRGRDRELDRARWRDSCAARRRRATCAPTLILDDIPMLMCGIGSRDPQAASLRGRLAPAPRDRARRPARLERRRPAPAEPLYTLSGMTAPDATDPELARRRLGP